MGTGVQVPRWSRLRNVPSLAATAESASRVRMPRRASVQWGWAPASRPQDTMSKCPSLSPLPRCRNLRGRESGLCAVRLRSGRGTASVGRPGSARAAGGRWRRHLSLRGPGSSHLSLPRGSWDLHRPCGDLVVYTCLQQSPGFASVPARTWRGWVRMHVFEGTAEEPS